MTNKGLQEMIGELIHFSQSLYVSADYCLLFLVDSYISKYLNIGELLVLEIFQCSGHLAGIFLVKNDLETPSVVIDLENDSHGFLNSRN